MRAVVQRVREGRVSADGQVTGEIGPGLVVFLAVGEGDGEADARSMAGKLAALRIFADTDGRMNRSVTDVGGAILLIPQFTLYADVRRGNRPSFHRAAPKDLGERLYMYTGLLLEEVGLRVGRGVFGGRMQVDVMNDGPVTILIDTAGDL